MNEIALLIAFLAGHTFNTACVQTQDNGASGYAVDSISFISGGKTDANEMAVTLTRTMFTDAKCESGASTLKNESGRVRFSNASGGFFASNDGEKRYEADWALNPAKADQIELGSIGINESKKEVRIARNTPGFMRNSMLQLISYKLAK